MARSRLALQRRRFARDRFELRALARAAARARRAGAGEAWAGKAVRFTLATQETVAQSSLHTSLLITPQLQSRSSSKWPPRPRSASAARLTCPALDPATRRSRRGRRSLSLAVTLFAQDANRLDPDWHSTASSATHQTPCSDPAARVPPLRAGPASGQPPLLQ